MTPIAALKARHKLLYRVLDAGGKAQIEVWKDEQWKPFREPLPHDVADRHMETLRVAGNSVVDGRKRK